VTTVHQFHPVLAPGDAMSNHVFALRDRLREWGYDAEAYAVEAKPEYVVTPRAPSVSDRGQVTTRLVRRWLHHAQLRHRGLDNRHILVNELRRADTIARAYVALAAAPTHRERIVGVDLLLAAGALAAAEGAVMLSPGMATPAAQRRALATSAATTQKRTPFLPGRDSCSADATRRLHERPIGSGGDVLHRQ